MNLFLYFILFCVLVFGGVVCDCSSDNSGCYGECYRGDYGEPHDDSVSLFQRKAIIVSDVHHEFTGRAIADIVALSRQRQRVDVCFSVGDINSDVGSLSYYPEFLGALSRNCKTVFFIAGNHEFYGKTYSKTIEQMEGLQRKNILFLNRNVVALDIFSPNVPPQSTYRVVGCVLWEYVENKTTIPAVEKRCKDYRNIHLESANGEQNKFISVEDTNRWFLQDFEWLKQQLLDAAEKRDKVIVVTHHPPSHRALDLLKIYEHTIAVWIHGHTHKNEDYVTSEGVRIISHQGIPQSGFNFSKEFTLDL